MIPPDFDPWAALLELRADLILVDGNRWVCVCDGANFASTRTNGGFGIVWADHDGREAVWLAWSQRRSATEYPKGPAPTVWHTRVNLRASVCSPRSKDGPWRAYTWSYGPTGMREPGMVVELQQAEETVWALFARTEGRPSA